jgi:hypothetical protein
MGRSLLLRLLPVPASIVLALLLAGCAATAPGLGGTRDRVPERLRMVLSPGKAGGDAVIFSPVDKEAVSKEKNVEDVPRPQISPSGNASGLGRIFNQ